MKDCPTGKRMMTKNEAEKIKFQTGKHINKSMRIYKCDLCHTHHLTKKDPRAHGGYYD